MLLRHTMAIYENYMTFKTHMGLISMQSFDLRASVASVTTSCWKLKGLFGRCTSHDCTVDFVPSSPWFDAGKCQARVATSGTAKTRNSWSPPSYPRAIEWKVTINHQWLVGKSPISGKCSSIFHIYVELSGGRPHSTTINQAIHSPSFLHLVMVIMVTKRLLGFPSQHSTSTQFGQTRLGSGKWVP